MARLIDADALMHVICNSDVAGRILREEPVSANDVWMLFVACLESAPIVAMPLPEPEPPKES